MTDIFLKIAGMSLTASAVIGAVLLLRLPLRKAPRIFSYLLWTAALLRLLCPVSFELPAAPVAPVTFDKVTLDEYAPAPNISETEYPVFDMKGNTEFVIYTSESENVPVYKKRGAIIDTVSYIWAAGVLCMAAHGAVSYIGLMLRLRGAEKRDGAYISDKTDNPFIMGIFRPRIYLPEGLPDSERELIIRHERAHLRRGDNIAKMIMFAALCIHWFNPLVWVMFRLFERDMEMSCDERVTADMNESERADYSQALLNISAKRALSFTACFGENGAKQRIKNILGFKKPAVWITVLCSLAVIGCVAVLCADKAKDKEENVPEVTNTLLNNTEERDRLAEREMAEEMAEREIMLREEEQRRRQEMQEKQNSVPLIGDGIKWVTVKVTDDYAEADYYDGIFPAAIVPIRNLGYEEYSETIPDAEVRAEIRFYANPYNYAAYLILKAENGYYIDNIVTNSIYCFEISADVYKDIMNKCNVILAENGRLTYQSRANEAYLALVETDKEQSRTMAYIDFNRLYIVVKDGDAAEYYRNILADYADCVMIKIIKYTYAELEKAARDFVDKYSEEMWITGYGVDERANRAYIQVMPEGFEKVKTLPEYESDMFYFSKANYGVLRSGHEIYDDIPREIPLVRVSAEGIRNTVFTSNSPYLIYADEFSAVFTEGTRYLFVTHGESISFAADIAASFERVRDKLPLETIYPIGMGAYTEKTKDGAGEFSQIRLWCSVGNLHYLVDYEKGALVYTSNIPEDSRMIIRTPITDTTSVFGGHTLHYNDSDYVFLGINNEAANMLGMSAIKIVRHTAEGETVFIPFPEDSLIMGGGKLKAGVYETDISDDMLNYSSVTISERGTATIMFNPLSSFMVFDGLCTVDGNRLTVHFEGEDFTFDIGEDGESLISVNNKNDSPIMSIADGRVLSYSGEKSRY